MADAPPGTPARPSGPKIPLSREDVGAWTARIEAATKAADAKRKEWQAYVTAYMVRTAVHQGPDHHVTVPLEYAYTELKKSQLAFQVPEVNLKAKRPEFAGAVRAYEGALNHELAEAGADQLLDSVLTDVLVCGIAAAKIGYYADIRSRNVPVTTPAVDPMTGAPNPNAPPVPSTDPVTGAPVMRPEPYLAHECYYGDPIPPENLLFPPEFTGGDYDRAAYLGHRFQLDLQTAITRYGLDPTFAPTATRPIETLSSDEQPEGRDTLTTKDVEGVELFYLATVFDTGDDEADEPPDDEAAEGEAALPGLPPLASAERPHVGQFRRLVFLKGKPEPVVHEDSPYQYVDEVDGKLKGMKGNPIHVLTLRILPGSPYPVSDIQAGRPASEEVSLGRSQMVNFRERVMPVLGIDRGRASPELAQKLLANADVKIGAVIGVDGPPNEIITPISVTQFPRDNFKFDEVARGDFTLAWSMGARQAGQDVPGEPVTAEEVRSSQAATDTRLAREQTRVLKWWTRYAEKFGALLQMFKDDVGYAEIVGEDGAKALQAWNRKGGDGVLSIAGEFVYTARPDSALRLDAQADRQQKTALYTQLGNDPNVNRVELLKAVLLSYSLDPEKIVVQQLPEKGPDPPRINWSFKGEDLQVVDPKTGQPNTAFPLVLAVMQQGGITLPPEAIQNAMTIGQQLMASAAHLMPPPAPGPGPGPDMAHPGATTPVQPLNQHAADRDGMPEPSGTTPPGGPSIM
jgi:hypothetical protein